ncbi:MAG: hypothetical protein AVDCRST_MAG74-740 [uncultured Pyrinomonadaceae bacterium]|uniref:Uncharacterized protein n=1 Tax=uncultured Pyrinomonadaceae bacterium TaxID=2283094 RepID=A0A6J4NDK9_9BACT|nr:MAG: hypothetical protein AVDCRST_MAG74-740 [uncultured Pyrinomonadaceae bacterium]
MSRSFRKFEKFIITIGIQLFLYISEVFGYSVLLMPVLRKK